MTVTTTDTPRQLNEILRTVVGSGVHGVAIPGRDDHDEMGVYVEPPESVVGVDPIEHHDVWRTAERHLCICADREARNGKHLAVCPAAQAPRSRPGDTDLSRYSLRKFMRLAVAGNPNVLIPFYAPSSDLIIITGLGDELRALAPAVVSRQAGWRFLGYARTQLQRMEGGGKQSRLPNRPELVEQYGYDVKYASHALRLVMQGVELLTTGRLQLPMPDHTRRLVHDVKTGQFTQSQTIAMIRCYEKDLTELLADPATTPHIRATPDTDRINRWMIRAHLTQWGTP